MIDQNDDVPMYLLNTIVQVVNRFLFEMNYLYHDDQDHDKDKQQSMPLFRVHPIHNIIPYSKSLFFSQQQKKTFKNK